MSRRTTVGCMSSCGDVIVDKYTGYILSQQSCNAFLAKQRKHHKSHSRSGSCCDNIQNLYLSNVCDRLVHLGGSEKYRTYTSYRRTYLPGMRSIESKIPFLYSIATQPQQQVNNNNNNNNNSKIICRVTLSILIKPSVHSVAFLSFVSLYYSSQCVRY